MFKGDLSGSSAYDNYTAVCKGNKDRDKCSKHGCLLSSSSELLKGCRETAAGESSKWKAFEFFEAAFELPSSWSFPHISDIWELLCWLPADHVSVALRFMICGEILTQNGCHESPGRADRLLTDGVLPLLPHLSLHFLRCPSSAKTTFMGPIIMRLASEWCRHFSRHYISKESILLHIIT